MKTDPTSLPGSLQRPAGTGMSQLPSHRWLADLERAWLDVRPATPQRVAAPESMPLLTSSAPPSSLDATSVHATVTVPRAHEVDSSRSASSEVTENVEGSAHAVDLPHGLFGATQRVAAAVEQPPVSRFTQAAPEAASVAAAAAGAGQETPGSVGAMVDELPSPTTAPASRISVAPTSRAAQAATLDASIDVPAAGANGPSEQTPDAAAFGKRLLLVSGNDELQINLRDAGLTAAQQDAVAQALFAQMGSTGSALKRVYLNGQRYEPSAGATPISGGNPAPSSQATTVRHIFQPTSILNDKE